MFAMTPVTDDQVLSLMKGLKVREKRAMKRLVAASDILADHPRHATAKVFAFVGGSPAQGIRRLIPADVISLAQGRAAQADRKTIHDRFLTCAPKSTA